MADNSDQLAEIRVLVIDDDKDNRDLVVDLLREGGYTVDEAKRLPEALAKLAVGATYYRLVVSDHRIPPDTNDGIEDVADFIAHNHYPTRLLGLTGNIVSGEQAERIESKLGSERVRILSRPFDVDNLLDTVGQLVREAVDERTEPGSENQPSL